MSLFLLNMSLIKTMKLNNLIQINVLNLIIINIYVNINILFTLKLTTENELI